MIKPCITQYRSQRAEDRNDLSPASMSVAEIDCIAFFCQRWHYEAVR
jgi:hypothetical protein